ncbi:glycerophosphodiester phosphodiesterase [Nonomuraea sp. NPDC050790]|uniref:glycerophosphodiester phosphodiesterase n=1 Tax=Nonomuraea sp. NPDC050790 TaxID=3364371 RepID=UPI0037A37B77
MRRLGFIIVTALTTLTTLAPAVSAAAAADPTNVAHRGASAHAPENTIAAFQLAGRQGADMFELDVRETKDHQLVLLHDPTLTRTTNVESVFPGRSPWRLGDFTLSEVRRLDAGSWFGSGHSGERVPTLGETLRKLKGSGMGLLLEIKDPGLYPGIERRVAAELRNNSWWLQPGRLVVQSFDWRSMRTFHLRMPRVPVGLLGTPAVSELRALSTYATQINPPYQNVTRAYVRRVHRLGMQVFTWTVNDRATWRRMNAHGVDGIITDRPGMS